MVLPHLVCSSHLSSCKARFSSHPAMIIIILTTSTTSTGVTTSTTSNTSTPSTTRH